ncbi:MAG: methyltransferase domain-containing protein [Planctomycetaceae bacterium]
MPQSSDETLTRRFYDRISSVYDLIADAGERKTRQAGLNALDVQSGESVLEIGFGTGHSLQFLTEAVGETGHICGVDLSTGMHHAALLRLEQAGLAGRVELKVSAVPPIPWPDETFDAVTLSFTLELFPLNQIPEVLSEIRRVLKPGGRIGVVAMAVTPDGKEDSVLEKTYRWMHQHFPHIVDCQPIAAAQLIETAGFRLIHQEHHEIWSLPVAVLVGLKSAPDLLSSIKK